jgi:hypothetical protein
MAVVAALLPPMGNNAIFAASLEKPSVMQNRGALWIFTILLALACTYQLSFSVFTSGMEKKARVRKQLEGRFRPRHTGE